MSVRSEGVQYGSYIHVHSLASYVDPLLLWHLATLHIEVVAHFLLATIAWTELIWNKFNQYEPAYPIKRAKYPSTRAHFPRNIDTTVA